MGKIKWEPIVKARSSILFQWYVFKGHQAKYFKSSLNLNFCFQNEKVVSDEMFCDLNEWKKLEQLLISKVKTDGSFLKNFVKLCYHYSGRLIKASKRVGEAKNLGKQKNIELVSLYSEYQESVLSLVPFLNTTLVLDDILKRNIVHLLETSLGIKSKKEQDLLLSKLVIPKKKSFFVQETEDILEMAFRLQEDKKADIEQDVQNYLKKFAWMSSLAYLGKFQTEQDVMKKIEDFLKENPKEKLIQADQIKRETAESYRQAYAQIRSSQELITLINLAQEFIYLQQYRLDVLFMVHYYIYLFLEEIGKRSNLKVEELIYLTGDEIVELLKGKRKIKRAKTRERQKNYALIKTAGKLSLLTGVQIEELPLKAIKAKVVIKGVVANRGRATGKARLVNEVEDIPKVNRGDIIVSPMTHPKLVPAIIKASGIITDFGGMLCHAAIVSREFGIPCIVGAKNATKVFKDGDLVELNAYDGIARKL